MHERHHEIDQVYDKCIKELDCLTRAFQVKHVTYEDTKSSKAQATVSSHTIVDKIEQLKKTLDDYKKHNQQINEQVCLLLLSLISNRLMCQNRHPFEVEGSKKPTLHHS